MHHLNSLFAEAEQLGLSVYFDVQLAGDSPQWYGAAVQAITKTGRAINRAPMWNEDWIRLRHDQHPHRFRVYAYKPGGIRDRHMSDRWLLP